MVTGDVVSDTVTSDFLSEYVAPSINTFSTGTHVSWLGFLFDMIVVLVLLYGFILLLRFLWKQKPNDRSGQNILKTIPLRPNVSVVYLEAGKQMLILGVTTSSVNVLATLTDPNEIDDLKQAQAATFPPIGGFFAWIKHFRKPKSQFEPLINRSIRSILRDAESLEKL